MDNELQPTIDGIPIRLLTEFTFSGRNIRINLCSTQEVKRLLNGKTVGYICGQGAEYILGEIETSSISFLGVEPTVAPDIRITIKLKGGENEDEQTET